MRVPVPGGALAALGETERTGRPQTADSEEVEAAVVIQGVTRQKRARAELAWKQEEARLAEEERAREVLAHTLAETAKIGDDESTTVATDGATLATDVGTDVPADVAAESSGATPAAAGTFLDTTGVGVVTELRSRAEELKAMFADGGSGGSRPGTGAGTRPGTSESGGGGGGELNTEVPLYLQDGSGSDSYERDGSVKEDLRRGRGRRRKSRRRSASATSGSGSDFSGSGSDSYFSDASSSAFTNPGEGLSISLGACATAFDGATGT